MLKLARLLCPLLMIYNSSDACHVQQAPASAVQLPRMLYGSLRALSRSALATCPLPELPARHAARRGTQAVSGLRWH